MRLRTTARRRRRRARPRRRRVACSAAPAAAPGLSDAADPRARRARTCRLGRTAAIAVDLADRHRALRTQRHQAGRSPPRTRSCPSPGRRSSGSAPPIASTPSSTASAAARGRRGTATSCSRASATRRSTTADLAALARTVRALGITARDRPRPRRRVVLRPRARRRRAGSAASSASSRRPLSALVVDRAPGWPALSPPLLAAKTLTAQLADAGVHVAGRPGLGRAPATAVPLASDRSVPLAEILRFMDHESDNFTAEMLLKQLGAGDGRRRHDRRRRAA